MEVYAKSPYVDEARDAVVDRYALSARASTRSPLSSERRAKRLAGALACVEAGEPDAAEGSAELGDECAVRPASSSDAERVDAPEPRDLCSCRTRAQSYNHNV